MIATRSMTSYAKTVSRWSRRTDPIAASAPRKMDDGFGDRRWLVERFFAWIQWQRRILVRWEFYPKNFLGFVQLACLLVLFKRFLDRFETTVGSRGRRQA